MTTAAGPSDPGSVTATDLQVLATNTLLEALVVSESKLRRRLELLSEVVFELDTAGAIVFLNRAWDALLGSDFAAETGRKLADFVLPEDIAKYDATLAAAAATLAMNHAELRCRRADGATIRVEMSVVALRGEGWVGALRDVTGQRRYQEELERLSLVANYTDNFVIVADAEGRTEWVNRAFVNRTGYTLDDMAGKIPGRVLQGPATDRAEAERIGREIRSRRSVVSKLVNYTKSNEPYWTTLHITPILGADGAVRKFISVQSDSTELHETQTQLESAKNRAEEANREKSLFLANMSHELRTPMAGVLGLAELLLGTPMSDKQRKYVETMQNSANMLLKILNDILDFSKIEQGHIALEETAFDLRHCVQTVADMLRPMFAAKGVQFFTLLPSDLPAAFVGDTARIQQILFNLLGNALKFTDRGSVRLLLAGPRPAGAGRATLEFEIADTGIGMSPGKIAKLFRPFVQGDASTNRRFGGTGLGLWISQRLIALMGGEIGVVSREGEGSTFRFTIVVRHADGAPATMPPPPGAAPGKRARRILVADDNDTNRLVIRAGLERLGHEVREVGDGIAACEAVRNADFDVVLMDMQMPVMDGATATMEIRKLPGRKGALPIYALTADIVNERRDFYLSHGIDGILAKPINWPDLAALLDAI